MVTGSMVAGGRVHVCELLNGMNECICWWKRQVEGGRESGWVRSRIPGVVQGGGVRTRRSRDGRPGSRPG